MKWLALVLLLYSFSTFAQDANRGKALYNKCIRCHGEKGEGNPVHTAPKISGQYDWYIVSQIKSFLSGNRKNAKMMPYIKGLSDREVSDLGAYISTMTNN